MADLDTKDFPLSQRLNSTDRITITIDETGQQFGSMQVAKFIEEITRLLPLVTQDSKGLLSNTDYTKLCQINWYAKDGHGASIATTGINFIYAYQITNPKNFIFYIANKAVDSSPYIQVISSNSLNIGPCNSIGTIVITGAEGLDIRQIRMSITI